MKKNTKIIYISEVVLFIYLIVLAFFINLISNDYRNISAIAVLSLILVILLAFFGIKKDKNFLKGSAARIVTASLMTFILIIYGFGIILGFNRGYFVSNIYTFIKNIIPILLINIELEIIRFMIAKNSYKKKKIIIIFTFLSIIFNVLLELNLGVLSTSEDKFIFLSTIIFPIIAEESLCSYMTYKISMLPSLIYKLVVRLYIYIFPIVPNLGDYLYSVVNIILPFTIYNILNKIIIRYEKEKQTLKKFNRVIFTIPLIISFIILIILISGVFKFKMIAIASNSMSPTYRRGDAIIYEKINTRDLEVGDILVFQKNNIVVTHRIVKKWNQDGQYYFTTKGDNNNTEDNFKTKETEALGKVRFAFKYIGYPTVLFSEYFGKE